MMCMDTVFDVFEKRTEDQYGVDWSFVDWLLTLCNSLLLVVFLFYLLILLLAVLLLTVYHTMITIQNLTTNEHVKFYYKTNPFDFGPLANCWQVHCHPERVLAEGDDRIEVSYAPFGSFSEGLSYEEAPNP